MRVSSAAVFCVFLAASSVALAQTPGPASPQATPAAAPARVRLDPDSPAQAGRTALYKYLDDIAAKDEAERRAEIAKITTRDQALARQQQVRNTLLGLMGGGFEKTPLNAKVLGSTQMDGFRIEKILFESQPKFFVTALLYLPDAKGGTTPAKLPAIVIAPGHGATGKASDFTFASTFARNGFAVLSYDPIGQGERLQYGDPEHPGKTLATGPTGEHGEAGLQPTLIGDAVARYFVWDGMRAVDYLLTRPEIDAERIGAFGCSGGGVMTAMLGAADKRVKAIATACYLTTMDTLLPSIGAQDAEQSTPGFIAAGFDFADWVELAAPRPYAMVGTVGDMFPWAGFLKTAQEARRFYALFDERAAGTPNPTSQGRRCGPPPTATHGAAAESRHAECRRGGRAAAGDRGNWGAWEFATVDVTNCWVLPGEPGGAEGGGICGGAGGIPRVDFVEPGAPGSGWRVAGDAYGTGGDELSGFGYGAYAEFAASCGEDSEFCCAADADAGTDGYSRGYECGGCAGSLQDASRGWVIRSARTRCSLAIAI